MFAKQTMDIQSYRSVLKCQEEWSIINKFTESNTAQNKPCRGRKWKISKTLERKLVRDLSKDPRSTAKTRMNDLAKSGTVVSKKTIARTMHRNGLQGCRPIKTPILQKRTPSPQWNTEMGVMCCGNWESCQDERKHGERRFWKKTSSSNCLSIVALSSNLTMTQNVAPAEELPPEDRSEGYWLACSKPWLYSHWKSGMNWRPRTMEEDHQIWRSLRDSSKNSYLGLLRRHVRLVENYNKKCRLLLSKKR